MQILCRVVFKAPKKNRVNDLRDSYGFTFAEPDPYIPT